MSIQPQKEPINTANMFGVAGMGREILVQFLPPGRKLNPNEAINLAAWLVAMAEPYADQDFADTYEAVINA